MDCKAPVEFIRLAAAVTLFAVTLSHASARPPRRGQPPVAAAWAADHGSPVRVTVHDFNGADSEVTPVEIHIDTTKDSKDDVKKLIEFLSRWVSEQEAQPTADAGVELGAFALFDQPAAPAPPGELPSFEVRAPEGRPTEVLRMVDEPNPMEPRRFRVVPY